VTLEIVTIGDTSLRCQICSGDRFITRDKILLNTPLVSAIGWDFANRTATCYVCADCGYIHWFVASDELPKQPSDTIEPDVQTDLLEFKKHIRGKAPRGPGDAF